MIPASNNFIIANQALVKKPVHLIEIEGYPRAFITSEPGANQEAWVLEINTLRQAASDLKGTSSLADLVFTIVDKNREITADFPGFVFEGKTCTLKTGFAGMVQADFALLFTGTVDRVEAARQNTAWKFTVKDINRLVKKIVFATGDDGKPTSNDHPKTVEGNPLDIMLDVLQTELGFAAGEVDLTTIQAYRDQLFSGFKFRFTLTTAPEAKEFLDKEILQPLGGYSFIRADGKYSVRFFWPLPGTVAASLTLTDQNLVELPEPQQAALVNVVTYRFDFDTEDDKFRSEATEIFAVSETKYGQQGHHVVEAKGLRSSLFGFALTRFIARGIFLHYGDKNPQLEIKTFWDAVLLEIGDFVEVTHALIPNREAGVMGVTQRLFRVTERRWDFRRGVVQLDLTDAEAIKNAAANIFRWAPDAVPNFTLASQAEKDAYMFVADKVTGQYSDATEGHSLA